MGIDEKSFKEIYEDIISCQDNWKYYAEINQDITIESLFTDKKATEFIKSFFLIGKKSKSIEILDENGHGLSKYRSNHTLSSYFFGIAVRNNMPIRMNELPRISDSVEKDFLYFWSLCCLYHDAAYAIEEESKNPKIYCVPTTLEGFISKYNIRYSLLDNSEYSLLIQNYYRYIAEQRGHVEHGIAAGMLFYDAMCKDYHQAKILSGNSANKVSFNYDEKRYSKEFLKHARLIANTIARHNMWVATTEGLINDYREYDLLPLIAGDERCTKISFDSRSKNDKEKLLFLLYLVDALEPIKNLGRSQNINPITDSIEVLDRTVICFNHKDRKISIICPPECHDDYKHCIQSISDWMNVELTEIGNCFEIEFLHQNKDGNIVECM